MTINACTSPPPSEIAKRTGMPFPLIARSEYRHMVLGKPLLLYARDQ